jgi:hypothetical protein
MPITATRFNPIGFQSLNHQQLLTEHTTATLAVAEVTEHPGLPSCPILAVSPVFAAVPHLGLPGLGVCCMEQYTDS